MNYNDLNEQFLLDEEKKLIEKQKEWSISDKLYSYPGRNTLNLLYLINEAVNFQCLKVEEYALNQIIISNKFIVTGNGKWRINGKNKWYKHQINDRYSAEAFIIKYITQNKYENKS